MFRIFPNVQNDYQESAVGVRRSLKPKNDFIKNGASFNPNCNKREARCVEQCFSFV